MRRLRNAIVMPLEAFANDGSSSSLSIAQQSSQWTIRGSSSFFALALRSPRRALRSHS